MNLLKEYYRKRIKEYEKIYHRNDQIRLSEQNLIANTLQTLMKNKCVLEIASGTGYWTQFISETASKIVISDINKEMLEYAKSKNYNCKTEFRVENAFNLSLKNNQFDAGVANFWFSHVPKENIAIFLNEFHRVLNKDAIVFIADNVFNKGIGGKLIKTKRDSNSYKLRKLEDGSYYKIIKNYYTIEQIFNLFSKYDKRFSESNIFYGNCFWFIFYHLNS